jgi:hypothetical protein
MRRDDCAGVRPQGMSLAEGFRVSHVQRYCEETLGRVQRREDVLCPSAGHLCGRGDGPTGADEVASADVDEHRPLRQSLCPSA